MQLRLRAAQEHAEQLVGRCRRHSLFAARAPAAKIAPPYAGVAGRRAGRGCRSRRSPRATVGRTAPPLAQRILEVAPAGTSAGGVHVDTQRSAVAATASRCGDRRVRDAADVALPVR